MSLVSHEFGYAIVRAGASTSYSFSILYVFRSLEKAHSTITKFAHSSSFTPVPCAAPDSLRELDSNIPDWWKCFKLFEDGYRPIGSVYIERVMMGD